MILGVGDDAAIVEVAGSHGRSRSIRRWKECTSGRLPRRAGDCQQSNRAGGLRSRRRERGAALRPRLARAPAARVAAVHIRLAPVAAGSVRPHRGCARGGHTSIGARENRLALHVTLVGPCFAAPRSRRGARPGDSILVTGSFGGSSLESTFAPRRESKRRGPSPTLGSAPRSTSPTAWRATSGVSRAPPGWRSCSTRRRFRSRRPRGRSRASRETTPFHALEDGEDYELALAVTPGRSGRALAVARRHRFKLSIVGNCLPGRGIYLREAGGKIRPIEPGGYVQRSKPLRAETSAARHRAPHLIAPVDRGSGCTHRSISHRRRRGHASRRVGERENHIVRGLARGLGFEGRVGSPTYALCATYEARRWAPAPPLRRLFG